MTGPKMLSQNTLMTIPVGYVADDRGCVALAAMSPSGVMRMLAANLLRVGTMSGISSPSLISDVAAGRVVVAADQYEKFAQNIQPFLDAIAKAGGGSVGYGLPKMTPVYGGALHNHIYFGLVECDMGTHQIAAASKEAVKTWAEQVVQDIINNPDLDGPSAMRVFQNDLNNYVNIVQIEASPSLKTTLAVASLGVAACEVQAPSQAAAQPAPQLAV